MTYILGWKNQSSVFLTADTAITYNAPSIINAKKWSTMSTFGEKHILDDNNIIQEQWLKIYNIDDKLILAFAGMVNTAHATIESLKFSLNCSSWRDIKGCFKNVCQNYSGGEVQIIAGFIENENPILISYNCNTSGGFKEHEVYEPVHGGRIGEEFKTYSNRLVAILKDAKFNDEQILATICGACQSFKTSDIFLLKSHRKYFVFQS